MRAKIVGFIVSASLMIATSAFSGQGGMALNENYKIYGNGMVLGAPDGTIRYRPLVQTPQGGAAISGMKIKREITLYNIRGGVGGGTEDDFTFLYDTSGKEAGRILSYNSNAQLNKTYVYYSQYDKHGNPTTINYNNLLTPLLVEHNLAYIYDTKGRISTITTTHDGSTISTDTYTYDNDGSYTVTTIWPSGHKFVYHYLSSGIPTSINQYSDDGTLLSSEVRSYNNNSKNTETLYPNSGTGTATFPGITQDVLIMLEWVKNP